MMQSQIHEQAALQWAGLQLSLFEQCPDAAQSQQAQQDALAQHALAYFEGNQTTSPDSDDGAQALLLALDPQQDLPKRAGDDGGPPLQIDDERCEFFRQVGCRMLLTEMVVQSVRDLVLVRDEARAARLKAKSEVEWEEVATSAQWLQDPLGRLAVQVLFPDWDHEAIIKRIHDDPQGILKRFDAWGAVSSAVREQGFSALTLAANVDWSRFESDEPSCSA